MEQNLSSYKIFYTVAKTHNISHAAKELYISQPAISKSITKLEASLNTKLFHRNSRGVTLTEEGQLLFEHLDTAFASIKEAEDSIHKIQKLGIGHIRIGVSATLCKYILLPYLKDFISENPHIRVSIECRSTYHTLKLLEENQIDIGLIGQSDYLHNVHFYPLHMIKDCFVATRSYIDNLILRENCSMDEILSYGNLMLLDEKNITRTYIEHYFHEQGIHPSQVLEISNMDLLIEFAKIGLGIACVVKEFVKEELEQGTLIEIPLSPAIKERQIGFAISNQIPSSTAMDKFLDFVHIDQ